MTNTQDRDRHWMQMALKAAERGCLTVSPNPRVGCVIVKDERLLATGFHEAAGQAHAEINALQAARQAGHDVSGATAYVTLEPCVHHGRTGPCTEALIEAGIARVVAAVTDPDPRVASGGFQKLRAAGISVTVGVCQAAAIRLNRGFFSRIQRQRPWVRIKTAASLDGKTALSNGVSQWLTGPAARHDNQWFRAEADVILTGIGTVLADDPLLTVRDIKTQKQPLRVVVDTRFRFPEDAKMIDGSPILVVVSEDNPQKRRRLAKRNVQTRVLGCGDNRVDLDALMDEFNTRQINLVHVEAGAVLNGALLSAGLADELLLYQAPKIVGDTAKGMFTHTALMSLEEASELLIEDCRLIGEDIRIKGIFERTGVAAKGEPQ